MGLYERLVARLKDEAGSLESSVNEARAAISALLRQHDVDTCEALDAAIKTKREELAGAVRERRLARERDGKARQALADANALVQKFHGLDAARQDLAMLEGDREKFDAFVRRIAATSASPRRPATESRPLKRFKPRKPRRTFSPMRPRGRATPWRPRSSGSPKERPLPVRSDTSKR